MPILSIFDPIVTTIITGGARPFFSIVPLKDAGGGPGVTTFILESVALDLPGPVPFDYQTWAGRLSQVARHHVPGLFSRDRTCDGGIHICRKPTLGGTGYLAESAPLGTGQVRVVASEYLTVAPIAARHCASLVVGGFKRNAVGVFPAARPLIGHHLPTVAAQPYRSLATPVPDSWPCVVELSAHTREIQLRVPPNAAAAIP